MQIKRITGLIGSILLIAGPFSPILKLPSVGQISYFHHGHGDGILLLTFGMISLVAVLLKRYNLLYFTGISSLAMVTFTFYNIYQALRKIKMQLSRELSGQIQGIDQFINSIQVEWGVVVIGIGIVLVLITPLIKKNKSITIRKG
ncbi:MAG: hypothetical protein ABFC84_07785 [Veillonellales bacterium]